MNKKILSAILACAMLFAASPAVIAEDSGLALKAESHLKLDRETGYMHGIDGIPTVAELAKNFESPITVKSASGESKADDKLVACDDVISSGNDSLKALIYGDVNRDGKVSIGDAIDVLKIIAGWDTTVNKDAADVEKDGKVNVSDAIKLLKYVANWSDISLGNVRMVLDNSKQTAPSEDSRINMYFASMMKKIARENTTPTGNNAFKMSLARNESESCQVILAASEDKEGLSAEISDFEYEYGGHSLKAHLNWEHYYKIYVTDKVSGMKREQLNDLLLAGEGYYPEALPEMAETFELAANKSQGIQITATADKDSPAGMYRAALNIKNAAGDVVKTAYVYAYVWDFTLPDTPYSASAFSLCRYDLYAYTREYDNLDLYKEFYDFLLDYNLSAYNLPYDVTTPEGEAYMNDPRVSAFVISGMEEAYAGEMHHSDEYIVEAYNKIINNPEWAKKGYFYYTDEPYETGLYNVKTRWEYLRDLLGTDNFRNLTPLASNTSYPDKECQRNGIDPVEYIKPYINLWCPQSGAFLDYADGGKWSSARSVQDYGNFSTRSKEFRDRGDEMWWYVCCAPEFPYANLFFWYQGIVIRDLLWQQYMCDIDGLLYYGTSVGWDKVSSRRYDSENGDGLLLYYGQLYGQRGPVASWRLVQLRDAFDDFDYLRMAEELCGRETVMKVVGRVTTNLLKFTEDVNVLEACRAEIAEMIVAAQAK